MSKLSLGRLSGISDFTIRRIENDSDARSDTWRLLLEALASLSPFSPDESLAIIEQTGLTADTIASINRRARAAEPKPPPRKSAESRIRAVLDAHPSKADDFATLIEAAARLLD